MITNEIVGAIILCVIPLLVSVIALITPIVKLNTTITKLNVTIDQLCKSDDDINDTLELHNMQIADHEKRLFFIEHRAIDDGK